MKEAENIYKNKFTKNKKALFRKKIKKYAILNFKIKDIIHDLLIFHFIIIVSISLSETQKNDGIKRNLISLIINQKGTQKILNTNGEFSKPDKVIINKKNEIITENMTFDLSQEHNTIELFWEYTFISSFKEMFKEIKNIISIDLSYFDTSKITDMYGMFNDCSLLQFINFTNIDTSSVINMGCMFCHTTLTSLDLSYFNTSSVQSMKYMFYYCINLKTLNLSNFNTKSVIHMNYMFSNMYSLISLDLSNFDTSSLTDMNNMFEDSNSLVSVNLISFEEKNNVITANNLFSNNTEKLIYCIDENKSPNIALKLKSENFLNECDNICFLKYKIIIINKKECVNGCNKRNRFTCDTNDICYNDCIDKDSDNKKNEKLNNQNFSSENFFKESQNVNIENITIIDGIIKNIKEDIINGNLNSLLKNITKGKNDLLVKTNDTIFQITTTENQKNNTYENISTLNLGDCENRLKQIYNIPTYLSLIIFKIDYYKEGSLIPIIFYEIYHPLDKSQLDLNYCKDILISLNIPVSIDEDNYFKYDPNSEYYNDECYAYTTENGTDIILNDRQNEYNDNNLSICENNCILMGYDNATKKASCECAAKSRISLISEIIDDDKILSNDFVNGDNYTYNIVTMKCIYTLFSKDGLLTNIGNYILFFSLFVFIISIIIFYKCGYLMIENDINQIKDLKTKERKKIHYHTNNKKDNYEINQIKKNNIKKKNKKPIIKNLLISKGNPLKRHLRKTPTQVKQQNNISNSRKNILISNEFQRNRLIIFKTEKNHKNINILHKIQYKECEMNSFSYKEALKNDRRTFFQFYFALLKIKNLILFAFYPVDDYNVKSIKISLFILFFDIYFAINTLFFNHSTIHQIYEDNGFYNISFFIPKIIYSFMISYIIITFIKYFSLSENNVLELKRPIKKGKFEDKKESIKNRIIIKYIIFFVLSILFLILFWFYLSSFCAVYKNSQIFLIKNTLISFCIGLIYPLIFILLPCSLRIISLKKRNEFIYKVSKITQIM